MTKTMIALAGLVLAAWTLPGAPRAQVLGAIAVESSSGGGVRDVESSGCLKVLAGERAAGKLRVTAAFPEFGWYVLEGKGAKGAVTILRCEGTGR